MALMVPLGPVSLPVSSDKVRWYMVFGFQSVVFKRKSIPSHTTASRFVFSPVGDYAFHGVFLRFVCSIDGCVCTLIFGFSTHSVASFVLGRYSRRVLGRPCPFALWRAFALLRGRPCWLSYFLVHILPLLLSRRLTVVRRVA